jgi:hypothetical protein
LDYFSRAIFGAPFLILTAALGQATRQACETLPGCRCDAGCGARFRLLWTRAGAVNASK